jgi:hypothetical protein
MSTHASTCTCVSCMCRASAEAWLRRPNREYPTPAVMAGILLREMDARAALRYIYFVIRYLRAARTPLAPKPIAVPKLRVMQGGKP